MCRCWEGHREEKGVQAALQVIALEESSDRVHNRTSPQDLQQEQDSHPMLCCRRELGRRRDHHGTSGVQGSINTAEPATAGSENPNNLQVKPPFKLDMDITCELPLNRTLYGHEDAVCHTDKDSCVPQAIKHVHVNSWSV